MEVKDAADGLTCSRFLIAVFFLNSYLLFRNVKEVFFCKEGFSKKTADLYDFWLHAAFGDLLRQVTALQADKAGADLHLDIIMAYRKCGSF